MKRLRAQWRTYRPRRLLGRRGALLLVLGSGSAFLLALVEYAIALFLVVFLASLGFMDADRLPAWWPFPPEAFGTWTIWLMLLGIGVVQGVARVTMYQSRLLCGERISARLKMVLGYIVLKKENIRALPLSRIEFYMSECFPKAIHFIFSALQTLSFAIEALVLAAGMLLLARGEALVGLAGMLVMGSLVLRLYRLTNRMAQRVPEAGASLERTKLRISRNWVLIKILRIQQAERDKMNDAIFRYYRHNVLAQFFANFGAAIIPVIGIVVIALMVSAHIHWFDTTPANFVAFLYLFVRLQQKLATGVNIIGGLYAYRPQYLQSLNLYHQLQPGELREALAAEAYFSLRNRTLPVAPSTRTPAPRLPTPATGAHPPGVRIASLSFRWPDTQSPVLRTLSADFPPGAQCGIVGPNGSGKSTLLGLVLGIYEPTAGAVYLDGQTAKRYLETHPADIAYVGPEPYLVHGTIRENLVYGMPDAPRDEVLLDMLHAVRLNAFVRTLPAGLDYEIQEDGAGLSSGQKQRLTIARALLRQPLLLVLDEPSANLDDDTESVLVDTLCRLKGRCTVLIASHKPGTLRDADQRLNLTAPEASA